MLNNEENLISLFYAIMIEVHRFIKAIRAKNEPVNKVIDYYVAEIYPTSHQKTSNPDKLIGHDHRGYYVHRVMAPNEEYYILRNKMKWEDIFEIADPVIVKTNTEGSIKHYYDMYICFSYYVTTVLAGEDNILIVPYDALTENVKITGIVMRKRKGDNHA